MSVKGHQDFWIVGARLYIQKTPAAGGNANPLLDLGVVQSASPTVTPTAIRLMDSDSGIKSIVDEAVAQIEETYEVTLSNMNMENLALLFLSTDPEAFVQTKTAAVVQHYVHDGHFFKVEDSTAVRIFDLFSIEGIYSTAGTVFNHPITDMIVDPTNTIDLNVSAGDVTAAYVAADYFIVTSLNVLDQRNATTFKVLSSAFTTFTTITLDATFKTIPVTEAFGAGDGATVTDDTGATIHIPGTDWEVASRQRGMGRIFPSAGISTGNVQVAYTPNAIASDFRLIKPQALKGPTKATAWLFFSRENFGRETVRECTVSLVPSGSNFQSEDFSDFTLTMTVTSDLTAADPAGRMLMGIGTVPPKSSVQESTPQGD